MSQISVLRVAPYYYFSAERIEKRDLQYEPIGGMQVQIAQTTEDIDQLGIAQTVLLPRRPGFRGRRAVGGRGTVQFLPIPVAPIRTRSKGYLGLLLAWGSAVAWWSLRERLSRRHERWSLVHVHCSELPWTYIVALVVRSLLRRPVVLTIHCSAIVTFHPETMVGRLLAVPARVAERRALRAADAVIVLTNRIRHRYLEAGLVDEDRIHVVPDGVRFNLFERPVASGEDVDLRGGVDRDRCLTVIYSGRLAPEKGWRDFVAAADLIVAAGVQARFFLYGDGNERSDLLADIERRNLGGHVHLMGHVDRPYIAAAIQDADVVVVPSIHEELGGTVLESMTAGRAIVAANVGGLGEIIEDGRNGMLANPGDPVDLARAITTLLGSAELRAELGSRARQSADRFDSGIVARRMVGVYRSIAGPVRPSHGDQSHRPARLVDLAEILEIEAGTRIALVGPHPDDIAFSVGGVVAQLADWLTSPMTLISVFTRSVWAPNLAPSERCESAVTVVRSAEDSQYARSLRARLVDIGLPDAGLRGYDHVSELGPVAQDDRILGTLTELLRFQLSEVDVVLVPAGVGGHVDHVLTTLAVRDAVRDEVRLVYYEDVPYVEGRTVPEVSDIALTWCGQPRSVSVGIDPAIKLAAVSLYGSQVRPADREAIARHALDVGGAHGWAERIWFDGVPVARRRQRVLMGLGSRR